ncbi:MAG: outer membrane beta-barrel domain-containing protein [Myxococcota bacterium]
MLASRAAYAQSSSDEDLLGGFDKPAATPTAPAPKKANPPATKPAEAQVKPAPAPAPTPAATPAPAAAPATDTAATTSTTTTTTAPAAAEQTPAAKVEENPAALDRIKAVPKKPLLKVHRFELTPMASLSLNDAYYQHYAVGGTAIYYPHDAFGIGIGVDYLYQHTKRNAVDEVRASLTSVPAVFEAPKMFAHLDVYWVPLYGKFSLFNTAIIPFDVYATAGGGAATAFSNGRWMPAVNAGIGTRLGIADWMALRFEIRDHFFLDTQQVDTVERSDVQNYVMAQIGLSFFIPPTFEYSF